MHRFAFIIAVLFATTGASCLSGETLSLDQVRVETGYQLARYPENRALRFRYAKASFHTGRYDAAKFHLTELMRSSPNAEDLDLLHRVKATVVETSPLNFGVNMAILPSTNIGRTSANQIFDTLAGTFRITGGGQERTGVGFRLGAQASYEVAQPDWGSKITYTMSLSRTLYPIDVLDTYQGFVGATWGKRSLTGFMQITPYVARTLYDNADHPNGDATRSGLRYSYEYYLGVSQSIEGAVTVEHRKYDDLDYLDGNFLSIDLSYASPVFQSSFIEIGTQLSRNAPQAEHLKYKGLTAWAEISRQMGSIGKVGLTGSLGVRDYDGIFPASPDPRRDNYVSVGMSFTSPRVQIFRNSPKITCQIAQNRSNIALYEYHSKDCAISFEQSF